MTSILKPSAKAQVKAVANEHKDKFYSKSRWLESVKENGLLLEDAPKELRGDLDVVNAAVSQYGKVPHFLRMASLVLIVIHHFRDTTCRPFVGVCSRASTGQSGCGAFGRGTKPWGGDAVR